MTCNSSDEHDTYFDESCVCNIVKFIYELQECASTAYLSQYNAPFLRPQYTAKAANTRPFILFTKSGDPFEAYVPSANKNCHSPIFRVESVDENCCAVLRALIVIIGKEPDKSPNSVCTYLTIPHAKLRATSSCVTVDLHCFCGIQCLRDAFVTNC
ncbi:MULTISPECIES: CotY/CotZ family spore coat protein [Bacillus]|uniref:CotY/CotZ family spore coat protein n=1 Tax=Bacillus TaxID=1386 RepID=UPI0001A151CF|nr:MULTISPECIES: CotY/CotZ family spore coat protein [Bacillus]AIK39971.1 spore coat Z family protein [Bacillus pseudomycoides]AJI16514.1 spore coat Z family protein [Bacillus pseudomycoides]EEM17985.1 Spore coat protein [Bacillus pseudomycoides DSM 12442]MEB3057162.1 CotY/CotZ family spore coat protein [Bacillus pseudomycoides]MED1596751.1 CotY/CotZ family spore coat protein [Bacillus pseudomycoides]